MLDCTIVVPTYNRADLIAETLDALLAQTQRPAEIIVIDDGSTDTTQQGLAPYNQSVTSVRIENSGELVARNTGLRAAKTPLVAFCDSDDIWSPDCLATLSAQWRTTPELLACYANFRFLRNGTLSDDTKFNGAPEDFWNGLKQTSANSGVFESQIIDRLLQFQPFFPSCMMVAREKFIAAGGWDEGTTRLVGCDFATALRVGANPPIAVVHCPLVAIRKHAQNFSADTEKMNLGDANVLEYVLPHSPGTRPFRAKNPRQHCASPQRRPRKCLLPPRLHRRAHHLRPPSPRHPKPQTARQTRNRLHAHPP